MAESTLAASRAAAPAGVEVHPLPHRLGEAAFVVRFSERRACRLAGQHQSTQRHEPKLRGDEEALRRRLRDISAAHKRWGDRGADAELVLEGRSVHRKRVQRISREEGLKVPARKRKRRRLGVSTAEGAARLTAAHPNHVWALDSQQRRDHRRPRALEPRLGPRPRAQRRNRRGRDG